MANGRVGVRPGTSRATDRATARLEWRGRPHVEVLGFRGYNSNETVSMYELGRARAWAERLRLRRVVRMYAQDIARCAPARSPSPGGPG